MMHTPSAPDSHPRYWSRRLRNREKTVHDPTLAEREASAGAMWLAGFHPVPTTCLSLWDAGQLVDIPLGSFSVLRVSASFGREALELMGPVGPVLHSAHRGTVEFFGTSRLLQPVSDGHGVLLTGGVISCPAPYAARTAREALPHRRAPYWLVPPDGNGRLVDLSQAAAVIRERYAFYRDLKGPEASRVRLRITRPTLARRFLRRKT